MAKSFKSEFRIKRGELEALVRYNVRADWYEIHPRRTPDRDSARILVCEALDELDDPRAIVVFDVYECEVARWERGKGLSYGGLDLRTVHNSDDDVDLYCGYDLKCGDTFAKVFSKGRLLLSHRGGTRFALRLQAPASDNSLLDMMSEFSSAIHPNNDAVVFDVNGLAVGYCSEKEFLCWHPDYSGHSYRPTGNGIEVCRCGASRALMPRSDQVMYAAEPGLMPSTCESKCPLVLAGEQEEKPEPPPNPELSWACADGKWSCSIDDHSSVVAGDGALPESFTHEGETVGLLLNNRGAVIVIQDDGKASDCVEELVSRIGSRDWVCVAPWLLAEHRSLLMNADDPGAALENAPLRFEWRGKTLELERVNVKLWESYHTSENRSTRMSCEVTPLHDFKTIVSVCGPGYHDQWHVTRETKSESAALALDRAEVDPGFIDLLVARE